MTIHIIEGPVGAGKTTYANKLGKEIGVVPLVLDVWMVTLFQADRPQINPWAWYSERKARCVSQILALAQSAVDLGIDAIVELGLIKLEDRQKVYGKLDAEKCDYVVHVLQATREERRRRVRERNAVRGETFAMEVSEEVFEIASDMWEPIKPAEQVGCRGRFVFVT